MRLFFGREVTLVDHTAIDRLSQLIATYGEMPVNLAGFECLQAKAANTKAVRVRNAAASRPSMAQGLMVPAVAAIAPVFGEAEVEERAGKEVAEIVAEEVNTRRQA